MILTINIQYILSDTRVTVTSLAVHFWIRKGGDLLCDHDINNGEDSTVR